MSASDQFEQWNTRFAGAHYFYGHDAGPVARRAVRYHRALRTGGSAIDVGCGEGQDLAFLAACGYQASGIELTPNGVEKTQRLIEERGLSERAHVVQSDLRHYEAREEFDLVLAVNCLQFLGDDASAMLDRVIDLVAPQGVLGLSLFARSDEEDETAPSVRDGVWFTTRREALITLAITSLKGKSWQPLEAADLWQWPRAGESPQAFVTMIAQRLK